MIKVIRKEPNQELTDSISTRDIVAIETDSAVILTEAVKQSIEITYDELGYPNVGTVDLGVQYDHRVT